MIDESFSKEVICSLSRSTLTLKASKDPMASRFRALSGEWKLLHRLVEYALRA